MRRTAIPPVILIAALLAACSGTGAPPASRGHASAQAATQAVTTSPARPARSPIEGTWRSGRLTEAEIVRAYQAAGGPAVLFNGSPASSTKAAGESFFRQLGGGAHRYAVITLRFLSGQFSEFESGDGRPESQGYNATYRVSGVGMLILQAPDSCTGTYAFQIRGSQLQLHVLRQCTAVPGDAYYNTTLYASFPFTKVA